MEELRKFLSFNKGERIAVISVLAVILLLVLAVVLHRPRVSLDDTSLHNLDSLLALRQAAIEEQRQNTASNMDQQTVELTPFPFNPNTMTEEEGRSIGLTDRQIRNIINYRDNGGKFYAKSDLAKLYTISEEDYAQLEPFIVLPEVAQRNVKKKSEKTEFQKEEAKPAPKAIPHVDLNTVDSTTLVELPRIGPYMAMRILEFRDKLGGYVDKEQLRDVKGMDSTRFDVIAPYINLGDAEPEKLDVNRADFKTLVHHPYLSYEQVKRIVNQREKRGMIKNWAQLQALLKDDDELHPLLEHYLKF